LVGRPHHAECVTCGRLYERSGGGAAPERPQPDTPDERATRVTRVIIGQLQSHPKGIDLRKLKGSLIKYRDIFDEVLLTVTGAGQAWIDTPNPSKPDARWLRPGPAPRPREQSKEAPESN